MSADKKKRKLPPPHRLCSVSSGPDSVSCDPTAPPAGQTEELLRLQSAASTSGPEIMFLLPELSTESLPHSPARTHRGCRGNAAPAQVYPASVEMVVGVFTGFR